MLIPTLLLFFSLWAKETTIQNDLLKKKHRFGVDGVSLRFLGTIAKLGDGWSGINGLKWGHIEPRAPQNGQSHYRWNKFDRFIRRFQKSGRSLQVNIKISNHWALEREKEKKRVEAGGGEKVGAILRIKTVHMADWEAFISAFVERYDADGVEDMPGLRMPLRYIQIGSEVENIWKNANGYIEALGRAYKAAKKSCRKTQILAAGFNTGNFFNLTSEKQQKWISSDPALRHKIRFIEKFMTRAHDYYDVLTLHLNREEESIPKTVGWFLEKMKEAGIEKTIWSEDTSSGPFLSGRGASQESRERLKLLERGDPETVAWFQKKQARLLIKKAVTAFSCGVEKVFISSEVDWPNYHMPIWRHMGLLDKNGKRKSAFLAYQTLISTIDGFNKVEKLDLGKNITAYRFLGNKDEVLVLWSAEKKKVRLGTESDFVVLKDLFGKTSRIRSSDIEITSSPVFVIRDAMK
jgi:hypothetical protein